MTTPKFILLFFVILLTLTLIYRLLLKTKINQTLILIWCLINMLGFFFCYLLRFFILETLFVLTAAFGTDLILNVSSGSNESGNSGGRNESATFGL